MIRKKVVFILLGLVFFVGIFLVWSHYHSARSILHGFVPIYLQNENFDYQKGFFALYKTTGADVVMFGDSHTFGINWNEALSRQGIINRGIRGDVTEGFLHRLDDVITLHPKLCFVMGGINDLYANIPVETILKNYKRMVDELHKHNIVVIIQATIYVASERESSKVKNDGVTKLNNQLRKYALQENIHFIDINPFICENGCLKPEFTVDGLHLNAGGYALWLPEIEKTLVSNGL